MLDITYWMLRKRLFILLIFAIPPIIMQIVSHSITLHSHLVPQNQLYSPLELHDSLHLHLVPQDLLL